MDPLDRRQFLATVAGLAGCATLQAVPTRPARAPLFEISLAQWSLHRRLFGRVPPPLAPLDFPDAARSLGIGAVDYVNQFFRDKVDDEGWLDTLKKRAHNAGVTNCVLMIDGEGALGAPDEATRARAVDRHEKWARAAVRLGCHAIRVNAVSSGRREEQQQHVAKGLRALTERAAPLGIDVIVENHGGWSSDGAWLAGVMKLVAHPRCGTLPDFGNFTIEGQKTYDRYVGERELLPFVRSVSAKSLAFAANGDETTIDYRRMLRIVVDGGYRGFIGIEYEGADNDEMAGVRKTKELLERVREELS